MSEDIGVTPIQQQPRYNITYRRQATGRKDNSANGRPGADLQGSVPQGMNKSEDTYHTSGESRMAEEKVSVPHLSRSRSFRETSGTGIYAGFKDIDKYTKSLFEIVPISGGDFNISENPETFDVWNSSHNTSLSDAIAKLGIDALPGQGAIKRNTISSVLGEYGYVTDTGNNVSIHATSGVDKPGAEAHASKPSTGTRQKQRARSEPAGPRKTYKVLEDSNFGDSIIESIKQPGLPIISKDGNPHDVFLQPIILFNDSDINNIFANSSEHENSSTIFGDFPTTSGNKVHNSDSTTKPKGKGKKWKQRNSEPSVDTKQALPINIDNIFSKVTSPENQGGEPIKTDQHQCGVPKESSFKFGDLNSDSPKTGKPSKKSAEDARTCDTSPKFKSKKNVEEEESPTKPSPIKQRTSGGGEGSPQSPRICRTSPDRATESGSPQKDTSAPKPSPRKKTCEIKVSQPCHRRRTYGGCCRTNFQGTFFNTIAQAVGCQLNCIANRNQLLHGFPGIQGLYTPDIGFDSTFYRQVEHPYEICEDDEDVQQPITTKKVKRSSPDRHGTPAFYSDRRHSVEPTRSREMKRSDAKIRADSAQSLQSRRMTPLYDKQSMHASRQLVAQSDRDRASETRRAVAPSNRNVLASQSSATSIGENVLESSQSTEPPEGHSLSQSKHSQKPAKMSYRKATPVTSEKESRTRSKGSPHEPDTGGTQSQITSEDESSTSKKMGTPETKQQSSTRVPRKSSDKAASSHLDLPEGQSPQSLSRSVKRSQSGSRESVRHISDQSKGSTAASDRRRNVIKDDLDSMIQYKASDISSETEKVGRGGEDISRSDTRSDGRQVIPGEKTKNTGEGKSSSQARLRALSQESVSEYQRNIGKNSREPSGKSSRDYAGTPRKDTRDVKQSDRSSHVYPSGAAQTDTRDLETSERASYGHPGTQRMDTRDTEQGRQGSYDQPGALRKETREMGIQEKPSYDQPGSLRKDTRENAISERAFHDHPGSQGRDSREMASSERSSYEHPESQRRGSREMGLSERSSYEYPESRKRDSREIRSTERGSYDHPESQRRESREMGLSERGSYDHPESQRRESREMGLSERGSYAHPESQRRESRDMGLSERGSYDHPESQRRESREMGLSERGSYDHPESQRRESREIGLSERGSYDHPESQRRESREMGSTERGSYDHPESQRRESREMGSTERGSYDHTGTLKKDNRDSELSRRSLLEKDSRKSTPIREGVSLYDGEGKDVRSVGDNEQDLAITLKCDPGSKLKSPSNNCIQLCASMQSPGNIVVLNVIDCKHVSCTNEQLESTDNESVTTKGEKPSLVKTVPSLRQTGDFDRCQQMNEDSNLPYTRERCPTPCDFVLMGRRSDICQSPLSVRQCCHQSACDLSPSRQRLYNCGGTTHDVSLGGRYSYRRANTGISCRNYDTPKFKPERCKTGQFSSFYKRDSRGYDGYDDEECNQSKSLEQRDTRISLTNNEDSININTIERTDDTSDYDTQNDTVRHQLSYMSHDVDKNDTNISFESNFHHKRFLHQESSLSSVSHDHHEMWYDKKRIDQATSVTSSENSECSSIRVTVNSCMEDVVRKTGNGSRQSRDSQNCDALRATQSLMESPRSLKKQNNAGFRGRSSSTQSTDAQRNDDSLSRKSKDASMSFSHKKEHPCTESIYDPRVFVQTRDGTGTISGGKQRARYLYLKKDCGCPCDDDIARYFSREDISTSMSKHIPTERLDCNVKLTDAGSRSQMTPGSDIRVSSEHEDECGEITSIKSITDRPHINKDKTTKTSQSERLSFRSSSFRYDTGRKKRSSRDTSTSWNDKPQFSLQSYPLQVKHITCPDQIIKNISSRSLQSPVSKESPINEVVSALQEPQVTRRLSKGDPRAARHIRRKLHPHPESQQSQSSSIANSTSDSSDDEENSENTLPASPGELESEFLDDDCDSKVKNGRLVSHKKRESCVEADVRKLRGQIPSHRSNSQDESHNSSSSRSTPVGIQNGVSGATCLTAKGRGCQMSDNLNPNSETLISRNTMLEVKAIPYSEGLLTDECSVKYNVNDTKLKTTLPQFVDKTCYGTSSEVAHKREIGKQCLQVPPAAIRTKSPRFHHVISPVTRRQDDIDHEIERNLDQSKSRSNSASHRHMTKIYKEGTIDMFDQIITPEQPLQLRQPRHMLSITSGVPFYTNSLETTFEKSAMHPSSWTSSSAFQDDGDLRSSGDVRYTRENALLITQTSDHTEKLSIKDHSGIIKDSSRQRTRTLSTGRYPFRRLRNTLLQMGDEKVINPSPGRRSRTRSTTGILRSSLKNTHRVRLDFSERTLASSSPDFRESHVGFQVGNCKCIPMSDHSFVDTDYSDDAAFSTDVVSWGGNKNFSSSAEGDRNSSSGNGDNWYPEYAYRCGVIDTLRLLDSDLPMSTPTSDIVHSRPKIEVASESCIQHHEIEDHLSYIVQSIPPIGKHSDEAFELIRENSLKALFYAEKLSLDWPFLKFYDGQASGLEKWSQNCVDYSSTSNVSSVLDICPGDAKTELHKLKSMNIHRDRNKESKRFSKIKYPVSSENTIYSKVTFSNEERNREKISSPATDGRVDENSASSDTTHCTTDKSDSAADRSESRSQFCKSAADQNESIAYRSESAIDRSESAIDRSESAIDRSESVTYLTGSDLDEQYEPDSNQSVTVSEEVASCRTHSARVTARSKSCSTDRNITPSPGNNRTTSADGQFQGSKSIWNKVDASTMTLHKTTLSLVEENRLRDAISKKLGFSQNFALIPVTLGESALSKTSPNCVKHCLEDKTPTSLQSLTKTGETHLQNHATVDRVNILEEICQRKLESKDVMMTFYVIALEKQTSGYDQVEITEACSDLRKHESVACPCASDVDDRSRKYYIFTRDELINAVEKCDFNIDGSLNSLQRLQRQIDRPRREDICDTEARSVAHTSVVDIDSETSRRDVGSGRENRQHQVQELRPKSVNNQISAGIDTVGMKETSQVLEQSPRESFIGREQNKTMNSPLGERRTESVKIQQTDSNTQHRSEEAHCSNETMTAKLPNIFKESSNRPASVEEHKNHEGLQDKARSCDLNPSFCSDNSKGSSNWNLPTRQRRTSSSDREIREKKLKIDREKELTQTSKASFLRQTPSEHKSSRGFTEHSHFEPVEKRPFNLTSTLDNTDAKRYPDTRDTATAASDFQNMNGLFKLNNNKNTQKAMQVSTSSSDVASNTSIDFYRSKSAGDIDYRNKSSRNDTYSRKKWIENNSSEYTHLNLLDSLVDGKLKGCLNKALEKWKSPKRMICFRLTGDNTTKERDSSSKNEPHRYLPSYTKKRYSSSLSSEDCQCASSQSASSATDTMTERSLTEESAVILSVPVSTDCIHKKKMSVELTQLQNEQLLEWINNSIPEPLRSKYKPGQETDKYVLSIKRKNVVSEYGEKRKKRSGSRKDTPSSDSGNITNSANDCYEHDHRCCYKLITPRSRCDYSLNDYKRMTDKYVSLEKDCHHLREKKFSPAASVSRHRCGLRKQVGRSEMRCIKPRKTMSVPRRKGSKKRAASIQRRSRTKRRIGQKFNSPVKSPLKRNEGKRKETSVANKHEENHATKTNVKTFSTSGISRIAKALNNLTKSGDIPQHHDVKYDRLGEYFRCDTNEIKKPDNRRSVIPCKEKSRICEMEDDSLAECEALESCMLTPIKEESQSQENTSSDISKSDFEEFVDKCRIKLMSITEDAGNCQNESRCLSQHSLGTNCCQSSSFQKSSVSSGNHCSQDESDTSDNQRNSFVRRRTRRCGHYDLDCENSTDEPKRGNPHYREYFFSYLQYINPFKSAFLRSEMHGLMHESVRRNDTTVCKNEDELLKLYTSGNSKANHYTSRMNLTPTWPVNRRDMNRSWRKTESNLRFLPTHAPEYTRSVPDFNSHQVTEKVAYKNPMRVMSTVCPPFRFNYMPAYLSKRFPQLSANVDTPSLVKIEKNSYDDESRNPNVGPNRWYSADCVDFGASYNDLIRRNWNESANNGSDESSSGDCSVNDELELRENNPRGDYVRIGQLKTKVQAGDAPSVSNECHESDIQTRDSRLGHMSQDQYFKQPTHVPMDDPQFLCREHACMSYDYVHQNYQVARVPNFAARNINGSGNMFGRGLHTDNGRMPVTQDRDRESDEEFTSATEDFPHYSSGCKKRPKHSRKSSQEIDDTCNHPDSMSYFMGDGPSGQFDNFEGIPKEDLLISLSPVDDDSHGMYCSQRLKNGSNQRLSSEAAGQPSTSLSKAGRSECELHGPIGVSHQIDKNHVIAGRSCFGQGDILDKRIFTQWYVDEAEKGQLAQRRSTASVVPGEKCSHRELWITPSENCDSSADEADEGEEDDDNDCEEDDEEENDEEEEEAEEVDDEDEEEDDDNDDDDEDDIDDARDKLVLESNEDHHVLQLQSKPICLDHLKEQNAQNNYQHQTCQDMNESKMMVTRDRDIDSISKRPSRARTITQSKRYTAGNKQGHQQSTGDHLAKHKQLVAPEKNMQIKTGGAHQHKFSLEQIKVPAIEKERVRFACDENGDWAEIGRGSYGCVYLGLLDGIVEVAIKDFYESSSWDLVIHEARMLMFLQDTGITPKFYGLRRRFDVSKQPSEYCIIMEYFGDGRTLFNVMSDKMVLGGDEWMDIVGQLVAGLRLIHRKNVLINDLKADNILIDLTGGRKIIRYIDVGMATYKQGLTFQLPHDQMSKYNFLAPEVREGARTTTRSDIYSLGYMLEQMCRMADAALGGLKKLVARCMEKNPARRPDIDDIVSQVHRFIASKASLMISSSSPREQFVLTNSV